MARISLPATLAGLYFLAFFVFLYSPLAVLFVSSFSVNPANGSGGFTLQWYEGVMRDGEIRTAFLNSLLVGVASGAIATVLALATAFGIRRSRVASAIVLPLVLMQVLLPGILGGIVLLILFGYFEIPFGLTTTVLVAHVNWALPFAFLTLYPQVQKLDPRLEEAAMDLGASPFVAFRKVVLPLLRNAIRATFLFSFTLSFDEFVRTLFVIGTNPTLPIRIWTLVNDEVAPVLPAMSMVIIVVSITVSLVAFAKNPKN